MTIPATVSASPYGTPYPNGHLSAEARLELYLGMLNGDADRSRRFRDSKRPVAEFGARREAHTGLINFGEDTPTASGLRVVGGMA